MKTDILSTCAPYVRTVKIGSLQIYAHSRRLPTFLIIQELYFTPFSCLSGVSKNCKKVFSVDYLLNVNISYYFTARNFVKFADYMYCIFSFTEIEGIFTQFKTCQQHYQNNSSKEKSYLFQNENAYLN